MKRNDSFMDKNTFIVKMMKALQKYNILVSYKEILLSTGLIGVYVEKVN